MTTPRLPPLPNLTWKPDGTPVAQEMDDVYFSKHDGLEETRAVFLKACGLPDRWTDRAQFTVGELGFGTGLNLLALWDMWKTRRPSKTARLDFVSFEGFPMTAADAARALAPWPELSDLASILIARWPDRVRGVQQIALEDGVTLTLHIDDIVSALPNSQLKADAWFLDGFAPAKNQAMWASEIYPLLLERSAPGAKIGTYTVAGAVRRGLSEAGFLVSKQPGFGRKRDRLEAVAPTLTHPPLDLHALYPAACPPKRVAIIGAGIAGASVAFAFQGRGAEVDLFDHAPCLASAASGNRLALVMPRLDAADTGPARALIAAYLSARKTYTALPGVHEVSVTQRAKDETDTARFEKLRTDPPLAPSLLNSPGQDELIHHGALIIEPHKLIPALAAEAHLHLGQEADICLADKCVNGTVYDAIILANGMGLTQFPQTRWLPITGRLGQVETGTSAHHTTSAITRGHYALAHGTDRLWGATFDPTSSDVPATSRSAAAANDAALADLVPPDWHPETRTASRAGIRATTPDKLPFAGRALDFDACVETFAALRNGVAPTAPPPVHDGVWLLGGLGARGFTFAPWLAAHIAALAFAAPCPLGRTEAELVSPMRFIYRGLKRKAF